VERAERGFELETLDDFFKPTLDKGASMCIIAQRPSLHAK